MCWGRLVTIISHPRYQHMSTIEVVGSGDRRSLIQRFERKSKHDAISELVDIHLTHCRRAEILETRSTALVNLLRRLDDEIQSNMSLSEVFHIRSMIEYGIKAAEEV